MGRCWSVGRCISRSGQVICFWDCCPQRGQPLRFCLVLHAPTPKAQHVQFVTEFKKRVVRQCIPSGHYGFIRFPGVALNVWFAAACAEGGVKTMFWHVFTQTRTWLWIFF